MLSIVSLVPRPSFWCTHQKEGLGTRLIYSEVVHWTPNYFKVPYGNVGKSFVSELARLYKSFATGSAMESIALKAATVLPILLLQKPSNNPKAKVLSACLESWLDGDLNDLLFEGRTIQQRISRSSSNNNQQHLSRAFGNLMFQGKTKAACSSTSDRTSERWCAPPR